MTVDARWSSSPSLGPALTVFRPTRANLVAGVILAALLVGGGVFLVGVCLWQVYVHGGRLPFHVEKGFCWFAFLLLVTVGVGLVVVGLVLARYVLRLTTSRVEWCAGGLRCWSESQRKETCWEEVTLIRETVLLERPPILKWPAKYLLPTLVRHRYELVTAQSESLQFDGNSIGDLCRFAALLAEEAARRNIPWQQTTERVY